MNAALIEQLQAVARKADAAGHGQKQAVYQAAADEMGISVPTLRRKLNEVVMKKTRKQRSDAGSTSLSLEEARTISAYLVETQRNNGKQLASIQDALEVLRANDAIKAERLNKDTGELVPLSPSAVSRALRLHKLHPEQLARPTPKIQLASEHPNHVWQIDPSLCVLYYLPAKQGEALHVMEEKEFYKNKPGNIRRIEKERVWRYVITDHASGWVFAHYVLGAESGKNLVEAFIEATQKRSHKDPVHGVPKMVMVDPGSANTGAVAQNLWRALGVTVLVNKPGQPWAKGQVEKANDIVERSFESRLKFLAEPPTCLDDINSCVARWMCWFNGTKIHSRTGKARFAVWAMITPDQLRIAPSAQIMRELAVSAPLTRKVKTNLSISYEGRVYSVRDVPGTMVGELVTVTKNPWREDDSVQVIYTDDNGVELIHVVEPEVTGKFGFSENAAIIGQGYKAQPDSQQDAERKAVERVAMQAGTDEEAEKQRKKKATPFGGSIDPMKPIDDTPLPDYLQKRGTLMDVQSPIAEAKPLSHVQAAKKLADRMGSEWQGAAHFTWLQQQYPEGIPEDDLPDICERLKRIRATPLRSVGGGNASA